MEWWYIHFSRKIDKLQPLFFCRNRKTVRARLCAHFLPSGCLFLFFCIRETRRGTRPKKHTPTRGRCAFPYLFPEYGSTRGKSYFTSPWQKAGGPAEEGTRTDRAKEKKKMQGTYLSVEISEGNTTACPCMFFLLCYFNVRGKAAAEHLGAPFFRANIFIPLFCAEKNSFKKGNRISSTAQEIRRPWRAFLFLLRLNKSLRLHRNKGATCGKKGGQRKCT